MENSTKLRKILKRPGILTLPGIYDCFTARIAVAAGFEALHMTGSGVSTALIGMPDIGLLTMPEITNNAARIVAAVNVPVIADADTGYGNALNIIRTIQEYERAGVAGVHIEDQVAPKKCGHMEGKRLVSADEMVGKIKAAIYARKNSDFLIIIRTDARSVIGFDEAVRRGKIYAEAGADMIYGEALESREEFVDFAKALKHLNVPLFADSTEWGKGPLIPAADLEAMGYKIVIFSSATFRVVHKAVADLMEELKSKSTQIDYLDRMKTRQETYELLRYPEFIELENQFLPSDGEGISQ